MMQAVGALGHWSRRNWLLKPRLAQDARAFRRFVSVAAVDHLDARTIHEHSHGFNECRTFWRACAFVRTLGLRFELKQNLVSSWELRVSRLSQAKALDLRTSHSDSI